METRTIERLPGLASRHRSSFLDYYKTVLEKVSFDYQLFSKEYRKALNMLSADETVALDQWLKSKKT